MLKEKTGLIVGLFAATVLLLTCLTVLNLGHPTCQPAQIWRGADAAVGASATRGFLRERPRVLLIGDSLTERSFQIGGWGASLAHHYFRRVDVLNRGFSGYNTDWALHVLEDVLRGSTHQNTALVVLFFGANDAAIPLPGGNPFSAHQHVPLSRFKSNVEKMVHAVRSHGIHNILLVTPPPVHDAGRRQAQTQKQGPGASPLPLDRTNAFTQQYAATCQALSEELDLPVVNLWSSMQVGKDWGTRFFDDGLHFTLEGNQHTFSEVLRVMGVAYPGLRAEALQFHFPPWDAINATDPASSFGDQQ